MDENNETIVIPEGTTQITEYTIPNHRSVVSVKIPDSVVVIGERAFARCVNLKSIEIPSSVVSIGAYAFQDCASLESITIPEGVSTIEEGTFSGCEMLEFITLSESVVKIREEAFEGCFGVKSITLPSRLTSCSPTAFPDSSRYLQTNKSYIYMDGWMINRSNHVLLYYKGDASDVIVPPDVKGIGEKAFFGSYIKSVRLGDNVRSIGEKAFNHCPNKPKIYISDSVEYIESSAFDDKCQVMCKVGSYAENWCRVAGYTRTGTVQA